MSNKRIVGRYAVYLLLSLITILTTSCEDLAFNVLAPPCEGGSLVKVPAQPKDWEGWRMDTFTPTAVQIKAGNTISFSAAGMWDMGLGAVGPDGREDWCECTVSERSGSGFRGFVGGLVGRIGKEGKPFFIGSHRTITAREDGALFLTSNDNLGPCDEVTRGSCYQDNRGSMGVCVEVK